MNTIKNFLPPTLLLALSALLSSLLGVWRDHLLAKTFGATSGVGIYNLDVYYAAFRIPDLLYFILVTGAISAAFIPIFTQYKKNKQIQKAWEFASNMLHLMLILVSFLALLAFIFAPQLAQLVAKGFDPQAFDLTVYLMRIIFLSPIIFTISSVFISLQDAFKTFFFRSLFPLFYNLGIILSIFFFAENYGIIGLTWGVIIGAFISMLIQLPALKSIGYKHVWLLDVRRADIQEAFKLIVPRVLTVGMSQVSQVAFTLVASFLAVGSITILYFANNIYSLPLSMIGVAFSITTFATLSELALEKTKTPFRLEIKKVMQQILFLILPATLGMILLQSEIIETILLAGKFTSQDALLTAQVLFVMLLSLFTHSLILFLTRGFYAYHDTKTPFWAAFWGALIGIFLAYILALSLDLGVFGVGIAMTVSNFITFIWLYGSMRKKMEGSILDFVNVFKMLLATAIMSGFVYLMKIFFPFPDSILFKIFYLLGMAVCGVVVYFGVAYLLKIPELNMLKRDNSSNV